MEIQVTSHPQPQLILFVFVFLTILLTMKYFICWLVVFHLEKAMAPHSSTLAWKIRWMKEPGRLQSAGSRSRTRLSNFTFTFHFHALEKEMATHSSVLVWRIPGTGEPGGLPSMGSHRVGQDWSDLAAAGVLSPSTLLPSAGNLSVTLQITMCGNVNGVP